MEISGEGDMSQEQLVEQTTSIVETIKKINETLKDTRISELCEKLKAYAHTLDAITNKKHYWFEVHFSKLANGEYKTELYVSGEHIYTVYVKCNTTIDAMFDNVFGSQEIKSEVVERIYKTLAEIADEISSKADLVERIKSIEEKLEKEDP